MLAHILEITCQMPTLRSLDTLLCFVAEQAAGLFDAGWTDVLRADDDGRLTHGARYTGSEVEVRPVPADADSGAFQAALARLGDRPSLVDWTTDGAILGERFGPAPFVPAWCVAARLDAAGALKGILFLAGPDGDPPDAEGLSALAVFAAQAAVSLAYAGQIEALAGGPGEVAQAPGQTSFDPVRFSQAVEFNANAMLVVARDGTIVYANRKFAELTGYSLDEVRGQNPRLFQSGQTPLEVYRELWDTILEGVVWRGELLNKRKNGELYWEQTLIAPITTQAGEVHYFLAIKEDITERKASERELARLKTFTEDVIPHMVEGVVMQDAEGRFLYVNPAAARLLGYAEDELLGQPWTLVIPPDQQHIVQAANERRLDGGPDRYEVEFVMKDGARRHILVSGSPRWEDGQFIGTMAVFSDITERKQAEAALRENERRYRLLFEESPVSLWEEDFSKVQRALRDLVDGGVDDVRAYLEAHPDEVIRYLNMIEVLDLNQAALDLLGADDKRQFLGPLVRPLAPDRTPIEIDQLVAIAAGDMSFTAEGIAYRESGELRHIYMRWSVVSGHEEAWTRVVVSQIDVTERRRGEQTESEQRALAEALRDTAEALTSTLDLNEVFDRILANLNELVPCDAANLMLIEGDALVMARSRGYAEYGEVDQVNALRFHLEENILVSESIEAGRPVVVADVRADPRWRSLATGQWIRSYATTAIRLEEEAIGALNLVSATPGFFTQTHAHRLQLFAGQVAIAIRNARLFEQEQHRRQIEGTLREASRTLSETLDVPELLDRIWQQVREVVPCDAGSIQRFHDGFVEIIACYGVENPEAIIGHRFEINDDALLRRLVTTKQPVTVDDALQHPELARYVCEHYTVDVRSWLAVPLIVRDQVIGQCILDRLEVRPYTSHEIELALAFANHAAIALDNAELYHTLENHAQTLVATIDQRERLIRELDAFAHTVAHDLKNPLSMVAMYAEVLLDDDTELSPTTRREYLEWVRNGMLKMDEIIDSLLLLAGVRRMTAVEMGPLDTGQIVANVRHQLTPLVAAHDAVIVAPTQWPAAVGYAPWIEQVWLNYISNAIKYGGQPPRVELGATAEPEDMIRFWVRDNGDGLTASQQAQLFTPFTRLSQVQFKGYGLGLSIVQRIVDRLGGEVGVQSAPGLGSTFWFTLGAADRNDGSGA